MGRERSRLVGGVSRTGCSIHRDVLLDLWHSRFRCHGSRVGRVADGAAHIAHSGRSCYVRFRLSKKVAWLGGRLKPSAFEVGGSVGAGGRIVRLSRKQVGDRGRAFGCRMLVEWRANMRRLVEESLCDVS